MLHAAGKTALDHEDHPADAEHKTRGLAPGHPLAEERRRQHGGEHRIGADDQRRQARGDAAQADIAETEIDRLVGDTEGRKDEEIAAAEIPGHAVEGGGGEHDHAGEQKARREQDERRAVRHGELGDRKGRAPEQAERNYHDGNGIRGNGGRNGDTG